MPWDGQTWRDVGGRVERVGVVAPGLKDLDGGVRMGARDFGMRSGFGLFADLLPPLEVYRQDCDQHDHLENKETYYGDDQNRHNRLLKRFCRRFKQDAVTLVTNGWFESTRL